MQHTSTSGGPVWRVLAVVVALLLGLGSAGCGGGHARSAAAGSLGEASAPSTTEAPVSSATPKTQARGGAAPSQVATGVGGGSSEVPATTAPAALKQARTPPPSLPGDPSKPVLELTAELKESCVRPGGSQTITIRTEPESGVGYDTVYSDGKSGIMEGHYGGNKSGIVDDEGTFSDTWVVAPNAPAGEVQVNVLGAKLDHQTAQKTLYFAVANAAGVCS